MGATSGLRLCGDAVLAVIQTADSGMATIRPLTQEFEKSRCNLQGRLEVLARVLVIHAASYGGGRAAPILDSVCLFLLRRSACLGQSPPDARSRRDQVIGCP